MSRTKKIGMIKLMKITILNESFFNESHLNALRALGDLVIHENTDTEEEAIERLKDVQIAIADCYIAPLNKKVLESADVLKLLVINSTGYDLVDVASAKAKGIQVANVPGYSTEAVAEHAIALMLAVSKKIPAGDAIMRRAPFQVDPANQEHRKYLGFELAGKTLGIVGLGNIGQRVAKIGQGFGMKVLAFNRSQKNIEGVKQVSLEELLKESNIVSLHLPLSPETENIITAERLQMMKPTAIFINTARGKCVDESALINALQSRKIAGAGLDTIVDFSASNLILKLDNVVFSPHSAFFTREALKNCADIIVANVEAFVEGKAANVVNF